MCSFYFFLLLHVVEFAMEFQAVSCFFLDRQRIAYTSNIITHFSIYFYIHLLCKRCDYCSVVTYPFFVCCWSLVSIKRIIEKWCKIVSILLHNYIGSGNPGSVNSNHINWIYEVTLVDRSESFLTKCVMDECFCGRTKSKFFSFYVNFYDSHQK